MANIGIVAQVASHHIMDAPIHYHHGHNHRSGDLRMRLKSLQALVKALCLAYT